MASFPSAAAQFAGQQEQNSPIKQFGQVVSLQNAMQQQKLGGLQVQEQQMNLQSNQAMMRAYQEAQGDPDQTMKLAAKYGAQPQALAAWQAHIADIKQKLATTDKDTLQNQATRHDQARALVQGVLSAPVDQQPLLYQQAMGQAQQQHLLDDLPPGTVPPQFPGTDKLQLFSNSLTTGSKLVQEALEQRKTVAQETTAAADKQKAQTTADEFKAKTDPTSPLYNPTAASIALQVQQGDPIATAIYNQEIKKAAETAGAQARAELPSKMAVEMARMKVEQAFANDKDARDKIMTDAVKPYEDKMRSVDQLQSAIQQANAGNVAAARAVVLKLMGVSNPDGTKRYNSQEAKQLMQMGNVPQRIGGSMLNLLTGDQWTPGMAQDIQGFATQAASDATTGLNRTIADTQQLYHSQAGEGLKKTAAPAAPSGIVVGQPLTLKNGKAVKVTAVHPDGSFDAE